jgi:hypothetical protein
VLSVLILEDLSADDYGLHAIGINGRGSELKVSSATRPGKI